MTTWKSGGRRGEIFNEEGDFICIVQTVRVDKIKITPWPEGEANFDLILNAPQMLAALEAIAKGAIISPDQTPEQIAEQTLRVLRLAREDCVKSLEVIGIQQKRAEQAEAALCSIRDKAECYLQPLADYPSVNRARWEAVRDQAIAAIAAVKGENDELV